MPQELLSDKNKKNPHEIVRIFLFSMYVAIIRRRNQRHIHQQSLLLYQEELEHLQALCHELHMQHSQEHR